MAWIKRTAVGVVAVALLAGTGAAVYVQRSFAVLDGQLRVAGLAQPVQVQRDGADVTHVRARTPQDAWFAMGYVHAQERTWQLEFNRRVMHGELSEVFGPATLDTDKLMLGLDIMGVARRQYAGLPLYAKEALQAYSRGIHAFHSNRPQALPPEFHILGVQPGGAQGAVWEPEDSVGWALMMALDLGGNWGSEFARLSLARTLDTDRLWQLMPPYPGEKPAASADLAALYRQLGVYRAAGAGSTAAVQGGAAEPAARHGGGPLSRQVSAGMLAWADEFTRNAGTNDGKGSNNWVIAGSRTVSGKPLLANDPHLGLSAPAIWYFAGLQAPAGQAADGTPIAPIDAVGATLPGLPFVVLGRTGKVAWGFTNTGPDVQDLYLEQINPADPTQYRTPDGWAPFIVRTETIRVKGEADVQLPLRSTRHGPVLSDVQKSHADVLDLGKYVLAMRWSALDDDNQTVVAGFKTNQAQSVEELFAGLAHYHSPMQSVVAADDQGHIRFQAAGRAPLRDAANDIPASHRRRAGTRATTGRAGSPTTRTRGTMAARAGWLRPTSGSRRPATRTSSRRTGPCLTATSASRSSSRPPRSTTPPACRPSTATWPRWPRAGCCPICCRRSRRTRWLPPRSGSCRASTARWTPAGRRRSSSRPGWTSWRGASSYRASARTASPPPTASATTARRWKASSSATTAGGASHRPARSIPPPPSAARSTACRPRRAQTRRSGAGARRTPRSACTGLSATCRRWPGSLT